MKTNVRNGTSQFAFWMACVLLIPSLQSRALDVIDPDGTLYYGVSDNSHYDDTYTAVNLFEQNLDTVTIGTTLADTAEYARSGGGDCFVAFQLDQPYTNIASVFYAQRGGSNPTADKIGEIDIWASATTPFTADDPGTPPDSVVAITNTTGALWLEYLMTNTISGQYFLVKLHQTVLPTGANNPGGRELRLGVNLGQPPGAFVALPADKTVYAGGSAFFNGISPSGTPPLIYSWSRGGTNLINGGSIAGTDTDNLVISNVTPEDAGSYTLTVSNDYGTISASANLTVIAAPADAAETAVISQGPIAFYQLNELSWPTAFDFVGSYNGTYGGSSGLGTAGPQPPDFPGFAATNTAVQTTAFTIDSAVTLPPLNISNASTTNAVTILAWIYNDDSGGPQQPYTGIVFSRGSGTAAGLICSSDGTKLAYQWGGSRYQFDSGLVLPVDQWTLVALVYTTNFTTLYCGSSNGVVFSAVDNFKQGTQTFAGPTYIGLDPDTGESQRTFNGLIDDVAFFNRALSGQEINAIYAASTGINPTVQILSQTTNVAAVLGDTINLSVAVSGLDPQFQWYKDNAPVPGATNASFTATTSAQAGDAGDYYAVAYNQVNSATSSIVNVTVTSYMVEPIGAAGALYTDISESGEYPDDNSSYTATNLFDADLTGVPLGTQLAGKEWAIQGAGPAYLAFQVDKVYPVNSVFYAQRNGSDASADKITFISVWASSTSAFAAGDPGTPPDARVAVTDSSGAILNRYLLPATITGQYFLVELEQDPVATAVNNNIGGNEFRLGVAVTPPALLTFLATPPGTLTLHWTSGTLQQAPDVTGPWTTATNVISDVPIATTNARSFYRIKY